MKKNGMDMKEIRIVRLIDGYKYKDCKIVFCVRILSKIWVIRY